jgi:hypothetical protein
MFTFQKQLQIVSLAVGLGQLSWLLLQKTHFLNHFHCDLPMFTSQKQLQSVDLEVGLGWLSWQLG